MCYSNSKSSWQMKGILSYRNGCRRHTLPAVYSAFTPSLLKWITKTIGNEEMIQRRSGWVSTTTRFLYIFYWNWKRLDKVNEKFTHGLGADCNKKKSMIFLSISYSMLLKLWPVTKSKQRKNLLFSINVFEYLYRW